MLNNTSKKFLLGFLGILLLALAVWSWGAYLNPDVREKRALVKYFEDIEEEYRNDMYGGATPEETLALFISALEAEDVDLASKYFLPDEREKWSALLNRAVAENRVERMKNEMGMLSLSNKNHNEAFFTLANAQNVVEVIVSLKKNQNNIWKIISL